MSAIDDVAWNEQARQKILEDADAVLRDAVRSVSSELSGRPWKEAYEKLYGELKGRFIDFEPGPDVTELAHRIEAREFE